MTLPHEVPLGRPNSHVPPEFQGGIFNRFAMRKMADLSQIRPTQWLDSTGDGMIPRGNAMLLVTASSKGKSTSLYHACAQAAATGVWTMFGTRAHDAPLKVVYISAEDNEQSLTRKAVYDGRKDAYAQTQAGLASGRLKVISLSDTRRAAGVTAKVFDADGGLTAFGAALFTEIREFVPDVVVIDTIRACSEQADLNQESVSSNIVETLDYLAEDTGAAVIATSHFTKEGGVGKLKITTKTLPSTLVSMVRGSSQLTDRIRHTLCVFEDHEDLYSKLPGMKDGDEAFIGAAQSNISGFKHGRSIFPIIRSKEHQVFVTHSEGKMLIDIDLSERKWRQQQIADVLRRLTFASAISGYPITTTGAYSPEKLCETAFRDFLPDGTTPENVRAAMSYLMSGHQIVMAKVTKNGSPNRYDVRGGPYANASIDKTPPPSREGAANHSLLEYAARPDAYLSDILEFALDNGLVSDEARKNIDIDHEKMKEQEQEQERHDEPAGMDEIPSDGDEGEYVEQFDTNSYDEVMAQFDASDFPIGENEPFSLDDEHVEPFALDDEPASAPKVFDV